MFPPPPMSCSSHQKNPDKHKLSEMDCFTKVQDVVMMEHGLLETQVTTDFHPNNFTLADNTDEARPMSVRLKLLNL